MNFEQVRIVLVNTAQPGNIGGAARAMLNMGFTRLYLVNPAAFPTDRATWRAAGAGQLLETATVCDHFDQAIADCHLIIGTSSRARRIPWPLQDPRTCCQQIAAEPPRQVALVFGNEQHGLTNHELHRCHQHVAIPANPAYASLNLSAAVQVLTYELRLQILAQQNKPPLPPAPEHPPDDPPATSQAVENLLQHLERAMLGSGFLDPAAPRQTMTRMRRMFSRIRPDEREVQILRGFLASTEKSAKPR